MIVVGGESLIDLIATEDALRAVPGGGPYNVARTIARLGRPVTYLGSLATDRFGVMLRDGLRGDGVDDTYAPVSDDPTTLAVAQIGADGAATYGFYVERTSAADLSVEQALAVRAVEPDIVYVGTLGLVLDPAGESYEALVDSITEGTLLALDPNCRPGVVRDHHSYRARIGRIGARADIVKVSTDDLDYLAPDVDHDAAARAIVDGGAKVVLVTDGPRDLRVISGGRTEMLPVPEVEVVDTVGAGDSFLGAVLAYWHAHGFGPGELGDQETVVAAVRFGMAVSGITCQRTGADPPGVDELDGELAKTLRSTG